MKDSGRMREQGVETETERKEADAEQDLLTDRV